MTRPRFSADNYAAAYLAAVERALRFQAVTRLLSARAQRLEAIRGPALWARPSSPGAPRPC